MCDEDIYGLFIES